MKKIWSYLIILLVFSWGLGGCSDRLTPPELSTVEQTSEPFTTGKLNEVAPPSLIQQLQPALEQYQPQVSIISPKADQVLSDTTVEVQLQVQDLPLLKNPDLGLGLHLNLIIDNEPSQAIYTVDQPIILEKLTPGTHTLRVFAARPWDESFKNEGAYAQTTFHIFTKTDDNNPDPNLPLLTYSRPQGNYGAEPIMLDFYLTNAPLHLIAQENTEDDIVDWRIRVIVNGESFLLDNWQPIYLKGFEEGQNWVQLEFIDEQGNTVSNVYNNTVRLISYTPNGQDPLSKLVRGEFTLAQARGIIDPNYNPEISPVVAPTPEPSLTEEEMPPAEPEALPEPIPPQTEEPQAPLPSTSQEESLPEISPPSPEETLPESLSTPTEDTTAVEDPKLLKDISPSIEESETVEEQIPPEKSTFDVFSSEEKSAITEEKNTEQISSEAEKIIPREEDKTLNIPSSIPEEPSLKTLPEPPIEELKNLESEDYSGEKPATSKESSKYKWLENLRSRLKRD
ncbi:conserved hypothetical protein [Gloeothece citriformis PCC 7424]|uniref:FHA domain containing protein n=1 Tax=Gloeothece citriformis (strain PCC 7424) TaxID=65393 RepID=B7KC49_GLOC7|nr:hypothetical protein [Gloeothece citriformis]ACK68872.1 conserved hypothetical protein [Gloeothece citriformis PCC 7424]